MINYNISVLNPKTKEFEYFNLPQELIKPLIDGSLNSFKVIPDSKFVYEHKDFYRD
jgi:hypothetical protein